MAIIAASRVVVPNDPMNHFERLGFFEYSTIYSYCLPALGKGQFAWNLGADLLMLGGWASLVPVVLAVAGLFAYLAWISAKQPRAGAVLVEESAGV